MFNMVRFFTIRKFFLVLVCFLIVSLMDTNSIGLAQAPGAQVSARSGGAGNSGGAWACKNLGDRSLRHAELLDLFEAVNEYELNLLDFGRDANHDEILIEIKNELMAIDQKFGELIESYLTRVMTNVTFTDQELVVLPDSLLRTKPAEDWCKPNKVEYRQAANFYNDNRLLIKNDVYNAFAPLHRAALFVHEAVYFFLREHEKDSDNLRTREIVGYLFSDAELQFKRDKISHALCRSEGVRCLLPTSKYIGQEWQFSTRSSEGWMKPSVSLDWPSGLGAFAEREDPFLSIVRTEWTHSDRMYIRKTIRLPYRLTAFDVENLAIKIIYDEMCRVYFNEFGQFLDGFNTSYETIPLSPFVRNGLVGASEIVVGGFCNRRDGTSGIDLGLVIKHW